MKNAQYKFPDEVDELEGEGDEFEVEIEDDTPEPDKAHADPLPKELTDELEVADDAEEYPVDVKQKFRQYKKAWHDERREKEKAFREQEEALTVAQKLLDDNKRLKSLLESGEKELINTYQTSAELEVAQARRNYKEAHDYGTTDTIVAAQEELTKAINKLDKANNFRPTISNVEVDVQLPKKQPQNAVQVDPKVAEWVAENPWYVDDAKKPMRKYAIGVHDELYEKYGSDFIGTDKYYEHINKEVAKRFPEEFAEQPEKNDEKPQRTPRLSTVVAPATRSTASRKVVLTKTQVALAKKFGLTPEQYARELTKLEA